MKTILVSVDFSRTTQPVVAFAARIAARTGARMTLVNVTQPRLLLREHARLEELVGRVLGRDDSNGMPQNRVRGDALELIGEPAPVILRQARRLAADCIVMGARRPTNLASKRIGSTALRVIRGAECPVILVPAPRAKRRTAPGRSRRRVLA